MDDDEFICPLAWKWTEIYNTLHTAWQERADEAIPEPPHLLAPNSTDSVRHQRWLETMDWANTYGFCDKMPALTEFEKYYRV